MLVALQPSCLIEGEARGADRMARAIGISLRIPVYGFPADWARYGRAAGPIRNKQMLVEGTPTLVVAFHDNLRNSKGTRNMVEQAVYARIPVVLWRHRVGD